MQPLLECVPNFSVGTDQVAIEKIANSISSVEGVKLLHIDSSPSANRTVMTFAGNPKAVIEAAFNSIACAAEVIDMRMQKGAHPRIGATDVCPLIPLQGITMGAANEFAKKLGKRVGNELKIPVYLYEFSAAATYRKTLPQIRAGQYEGMKDKIKLPEWHPDFGGNNWNEKSGATIIGVRQILVAFNISLATKEIEIAQKIAALMRSSGSKIYDTKKNGALLAKLRAIGWYMEDFGNAQVSFNLLNPKITSPLKVFTLCKKIAAEMGVAIIGSELIGLMPLSCLTEAAAQAGDPNNLQLGVNYLMLDCVKPFSIKEKILEYALQEHQL